MTDLQKRELELLSRFDELCTAEGITYYAAEGTMLGAARHGGFIPWDDDIDVALPRPDYERLKSLFGNQRNGDTYFETPESDDEKFATPYSKFYDVRSTLKERYKKPLTRGVFLDVFPVDTLGDDLDSALRRLSVIRRKKNFLLTRVTAIRRERSFYKNAAIAVSGLIPSVFADTRKLRMKIDKMCGELPYDESKFGGLALSDWGAREIMPLSFFGKPKRYKFEDTEINGVADEDAYLSHVYGDWRTPPPPEKRVTKHDFMALDLDVSYLGGEER